MSNAVHMTCKIHCKKGFVVLTIIVFLTRIATVDMVLWDDTIEQSLVTASYGQYSAHAVQEQLVYLDLR